MKYINYYNSPLGKILLASDGKFLTGLWFEGGEYYPHDIPSIVKNKDLEIFKQTNDWLDIYFTGKEPDFMPKIKQNDTYFRMAVWDILKQIPYGETITYKDIAEIIANQKGIKKMSAQAVGGAVGHNPISIIVPCHRVVGSDGNLTGYAGGLERKSALLKLEQKIFV